jgi:hypothetical protein
MLAKASMSPPECLPEASIAGAASAAALRWPSPQRSPCTALPRPAGGVSVAHIGAVMAGAVMAGAVMAGAVMAGAVMAGAVMAGAIAASTVRAGASMAAELESERDRPRGAISEFRKRSSAASVLAAP